MSEVAARLDWEQIDTVLLDMDGTLIDQNYDNHIWNRVLPRRVAERVHQTPTPTAAQITATGQQLFEHMRKVYGTLEFYSLNFWAEHTQLDMVALHNEFAHLVRYRPSAATFLQRLGQRKINRVLATNADPRSLAVKQAHCDIDSHIDLCISSHHYGQPKENAGFWRALQRSVGYDPERTLFIDDNDNVLGSARDHGIAHLRTITQPDLDRPPRLDLNYPAFNDFAEIMPAPLQ